MKILLTFRAILADTRGATAIEYALIAGGISIVILAAANAVGTAIQNNLYNNIVGAMK